MYALILAGGKGTRLRPLTIYTPKPIVPVVSRPFLLYQLDILAKAKIKDITLSLSYQPDKIEDLLGDGSQHGVNLKFVTESSPMGTAGAYRFASGDYRETAVVLNGDILTSIDIAKVVDFHRSKNADATIVLSSVSEPSKYGLVEADKDGKVLRFLEKPSVEEAARLNVNTINAGIYILEPAVLDLIPEGENASFEYEVFPKLLEAGISFFAYTMETGYWRDIGTPDSYLEAHHDLLAGRVEGVPDIESGESETATTAIIDSSSVIGEGCIIKSNARITNSVLGPGVHVDEKALITGSVIWPYARISTYAEITDSIVGKGSHIGRNVVLRPGSVIGDKATIPDYSRA